VITRVVLDNFTAFRHLEVDFAPGINVFIGANATGKTHLLKLLYAACDITRTKNHYADKLLRVFLPRNGHLGRLVHRQVGVRRVSVGLQRQDGAELRLTFNSRAKAPSASAVRGDIRWNRGEIKCAYIPVKEMLAHAPGFKALYEQREVHFEETYADIIGRALVPALRGPVQPARQRLLDTLQGAIEGKVTVRQEEFALRSQQGDLEFSLVAEGMRKLALLWRLIQNGTLLEGSVLFWDEPEANLNPSVVGNVMGVLVELQRMGVQVFLATHDYVGLKELDLRTEPTDRVTYHALGRHDADGGIEVHSTDEYVLIHPNAISDAFADLYDRDVARALGREVRR